MANDLVTKTFGGVEQARKYAGALRSATRSISTGDDRDILKIDERNGDFTFGQGGTYVERGDLWAVNPLTIKHGYVAFENREIAETVDGDRAEILIPVTQDLPEYDDLPELDVRTKKGRSDTKWGFQMALELVCVEGPNKGAEVIFKGGSMGKLRCVRMMAEEIARRLDDEDADTHVPVVELDSRPYTNRRYGKEIFNPLMHIIEWAGLDDKVFAGGAREDDTKSRAKPGKTDSARGNGRSRDGDDDEDRRSAREARKSETDRNGEPVDRRKRSRDEEDVAEESRKGRGRRDEDGGEDAKGEDHDERPRSRRGVDSPTDKVARRAREDREEEPRRRKSEDAEDAPRGRRGRDRDEDQDEREEAPRGRRASRDRDEDENDSRAEKADDAPRGRRGRDDEEEPRSGPRGRRAAAGRR